MKLASREATFQSMTETNEELNKLFHELIKHYFKVFKGKDATYFDTLLKVHGISCQMVDAVYLQLKDTQEADIVRHQAYLIYGVFAEKITNHQFWLTETEITQALEQNLTTEGHQLTAIPKETLEELLTNQKRVQEVYSHQAEVGSERTFTNQATYQQLTRLFKKLKQMQLTKEQQFDRVLRDKNEIIDLIIETEQA